MPRKKVTAAAPAAKAARRKAAVPPKPLAAVAVASATRIAPPAPKPVVLFGEGGYAQTHPDNPLDGGEQAMRFLFREYKSELVESGAVLYLNGKVRVFPEPFREAILALGVARAKELVESQKLREEMAQHKRAAERAAA